MRRIKAIVAGAFLLGTISLRAQTAEEVVDKHIAAIGGKELIASIKSQVTETDVTVMGATLPSKTTVVAGQGFKSEANFNGQDIIQCITPTGGWLINPLAGSPDPQPMPDDQVKAAQSAMIIGGPLFDYKAKGGEVSLAGNETVDGVNALKVKLKTQKGDELVFYLDPATYYVLKQESTVEVMGQKNTSVTTFSNYKKTDLGFVIPYTTVANVGFEMTINVTKVEFNKEIDPKIFEMPK